jgi:hypothetical protein
LWVELLGLYHSTLHLETHCVSAYQQKRYQWSENKIDVFSLNSTYGQALVISLLIVWGRYPFGLGQFSQDGDYATGWTTSVRFSGTSREFALQHSAQTSSGACPAFYKMSTGVLSAGIKRSRHETGNLPPPGGKVKNIWKYKPTSLYVLMALWLIKHTDHYYLLSQYNTI